MWPCAECHKAKNLVPESGGKPTKVGERVLQLQSMLPLARVVYCSATGGFPLGLSSFRHFYFLPVTHIHIMVQHLLLCHLTMLLLSISLKKSMLTLREAVLETQGWLPVQARVSRATWAIWSAWGCGGRARHRSQHSRTFWMRWAAAVWARWSWLPWT